MVSNGRPVLQQVADTSQFGGGNAAYLEDLYEDWLDDSRSVSPDWAAWFQSLNGSGDVPHRDAIARIMDAQRQRIAGGIQIDDVHARKQAAVLRILTAYRTRGHLAANLDPLGLSPKQPAPDLDLPFHGLSDADLDTEFGCGNFAGGDQRMKLHDLRERLRRTYTGSIGIEFMHISDHAQRRWIYDRLEQTSDDVEFDPDLRRRILVKLTAADGLERYLQTRYVGQKRFSLEGGDSLIPLLDDLIRHASGHAVQEVVIGMGHRGRLNVLINVLGKPSQKLFAEFEGKIDGPDDPAHSGDEKYHMGFAADIRVRAGSIHVVLAFNPSHLEIVNPVVSGSVRARQVRSHDDSGAHILPVLIHGDAALPGQGVNMELFNMSQTRGYAVGGTLHVVVNNQIGFTTDPKDGRSTLYCTDVAKMVDAPVFHVNGDDTEAVLRCTRLAFDFRQQFHKDVVVDMVCYRRHGHNEADEPAATQPLMYDVIRKLPPARVIYGKRLIEHNVIAQGDEQKEFEAYRDQLDAGNPVADIAPSGTKRHAVGWNRFANCDMTQPVDTRVTRAILDALADKILRWPEDVTLHPRVRKIFDNRRRMAKGELPLDWGYAENLAYATLINEGYALRLVGQDTPRGAFFHRHATLHDQKTGNTYTPLAHIKGEVDVEVVDSLLSELAALAFEYGFATANPDTLVVWESQFGDFANSAQVVIDQFISSGEAKWSRLCGLVLLLPHGYEGQGPEHSSGRLERYLQLCAINNMQVCVPTTPAQMFHLLRRQMIRDCRKPLVVMTPKSLLRHKLAVSSLDDFANGGFRLVIADPHTGQTTRRVVCCSGKVYYDLLEAGKKQKCDDVAIVRIEQLYPFPRAEVVAELVKYPGAEEIVWCQEEPMNQGAWFQIRHHLKACVGGRRSLHYAGRVRSPAPASGHYDTHVLEQMALVQQALVEPLGDDQSLE